MPTKIDGPTVIEAAGTKPKLIQEFIGRVNSKTNSISIAKMQSPAGWEEPGQRPEFDEYTLVLKGRLQIETEHETITVHANEAIITLAGEWIRYSTSDRDTEYIAVCLPAFSPQTVHRDSD